LKEVVRVSGSLDQDRLKPDEGGTVIDREKMVPVADVVKDFCAKGHHLFEMISDDWRFSDSSFFDVVGTRTYKCRYCGYEKTEEYAK
jgi:hypothetical protein